MKLIPLTGKLDDLYTKKRYGRRFDHVFVSTQHSHTLLKTTPEAQSLTAILADNATVSIESPVCVHCCLSLVRGKDQSGLGTNPHTVGSYCR